jgi:hypothetical protein
VAFLTEHLEVLLITEHPGYVSIPIYKTNFGIDDRLLVIYLYVLGRELLFTGIAPVELCEAS